MSRNAKAVPRYDRRTTSTIARDEISKIPEPNLIPQVENVRRAVCRAREKNRPSNPARNAQEFEVNEAHVPPHFYRGYVESGTMTFVLYLT